MPKIQRKKRSVTKRKGRERSGEVCTYKTMIFKQKFKEFIQLLELKNPTTKFEFHKFCEGETEDFDNVLSEGLKRDNIIVYTKEFDCVLFRGRIFGNFSSISKPYIERIVNNLSLISSCSICTSEHRCTDSCKFPCKIRSYTNCLSCSNCFIEICRNCVEKLEINNIPEKCPFCQVEALS